MKKPHYDRITTTIEREWLAQIIAGTIPHLEKSRKEMFGTTPKHMTIAARARKGEYP